MRETEGILKDIDPSDDLFFLLSLNGRHMYNKSNLESEKDEFFDDLLDDLRRALMIFKQEKITDSSLTIFINEHLPCYIQLMLDRKYVNPNELIIQIKSNEFFQECLCICLEYLNKGFSGFFDIIKKIFNSKNSFYIIFSRNSYSSYYESDFRDVVLKGITNYNREKYYKTHPLPQPFLEHPVNPQSPQTKFGFHVSKDNDLEFNLKESSGDVIITINPEEEVKESLLKEETSIPKEEPNPLKEEPILESKVSQENNSNPEAPPPNLVLNEPEPNFSIEFMPKDTNIKKDIFTHFSHSPFYILNLVFFEKKQGIQTLLQMIHLSRSASQIISILDFIENLWGFFERDFLLANFSLVLEDIKLIPQKINEDEIKNSKKTEIAELLHTIEFIYQKFYSGKEMHQLLEIMELELYLMCFKSQYLEKRIFGLSNIISKIGEAKLNQRIESNHQYKIMINNTSVNSYRKTGKESTIWLNTQNMLDWLEKENMFDIVFGESIHVELISRALPLLTFLYENNKMSTERLDLIFELAHGKHEAYRNPATKILIELIEIMKINDLKILFGKLKQIPFSEITHEILLLLKTLVGNNRYLRPSHFSPFGQEPKFNNSKSDGKEFELKEYNKKQDIYTINLLDVPGVDQTQDEDKNIPPYWGENLLKRQEEDLEFFTPFGSESKKEENIREITQNKDFPPLIVSHQDSFAKKTNSKEEENKKEDIEFNQVSNGDKDFELDVLNHMWSIMVSGNQTSSNLVGEALKCLTDILAKNFSSKKMEFIHRSIECISSNTNLHESLQILEGILKGNYPIQSEEGVPIGNKLELVEYLEKEFALTNEILSSIITLKKSFVNFVINQSQPVPIPAPNNFGTLNNADLPEEKLERPQINSPPEEPEEHKSFNIKTSFGFQTKNAASSSTSRKKSNRIEEEKVILPSEEEKSSGVLNQLNQNKENDVEAKSIDLTQPTRGDKETLSISTDASSFDDLNTLFERNNRPFFYNNFTNKPNDELSLYLKEVDCRLKFLRGLFEISLELLEVKHIKILWEVLVVNAMNDQEKDFFFNFFHSIVYSAKDKYKHMKEDVIYFIYFDILLKIDHNYYNLKAFFCFEAFFLYINREAKLISSAEFDNYKLNDPELIGLDYVWELYLQAADLNVSAKAGDLLIKIFKFASKDNSNLEMFEALKQNFIETLVNHIKIGYLELQNFQSFEANDVKVLMILRSLDLMLKLIEESEGIRTGNQTKTGDNLQITIMNQINNAMHPKKFDVTLTSKMTLGQAKALIAKKLNPPQKPEEIMLFARGSILSDDSKSLYELRIENKLKFFISKTSYQDEEFQQQNTEVVPAELIVQKVNYLKEMFGHFEDEFIKFLLEKKKYNENEVAMVLLDEKTVEDYKDEFSKIQTEKLKEKQRNFGLEKEGEEKNNSISHILANRPDYFELFFEILSLEIPKLTNKTWTLLNHIPINKELHAHIKTIFIKHKLMNEKIDWSKIFNPKHPFKTLYSLQIVHSIIACGVLDEKEQLQEINERKEWREKFIEFNGFNHLYKLLFSSNISVMIKKPEQVFSKEDSGSLLIRYLSYIIEILKVYIHSYLLSTIPEQIQKYLNQAIKLKDNIKDPPNPESSVPVKQTTTVFHPLKFQSSQPQSLSNSYSLTPNFHSPNTSKSATPHCTTPPIIDKDGDNVSLNKSSIFNNTKDNSVLYDEFVGLTKHSIEKLNDKLRSAINFENLIERMLHILHETVMHDYFDVDVICLIENCFEVILPSLIGKPELLILLYNFENCEEVFIRLLTSFPNETTRKTLTYILNSISLNFQEPVFRQKLHEINSFKSQRLPKEENNENLLENFINASFENLENFEENESFGNPNNEDDEGLYEGNSFENKKAQNSENIQLEEPRTFFLKLLIPQIMKKKFEKNDFEDFFLCASGIIKQNSREEVSKIVNLQELFEKVANTLIEREIYEERYKEEEDKTLAGFLLLAKSLIELEPSFKTMKVGNTVLVNHVHDFLFYGEKEGVMNFNDLNMPKCKKKNTRKRGFELLLELCNKCEENFLVLLPLIVKNHENFQSIDYDSCNCDLKPSHGFIGLRNLGCTCYINSLIQQFYMIKEIRYCVLNCEGMTGGQENVLMQIQWLFANLKENIKQFLIPNHLIGSLKGYDNQPINLHIQQDVNEFFNLLSDKLENHLKETQYKTLLQDIIGGSLSHEIISLEEEFAYNGEREEPFYSISIEIKHKKNIYEALDSYIKGETLEGDNKYFCEQYNRKIKALKRCLIKKLPNSLILTLKRFEFDYNLMQKVKINDYFEFPKVLNMKKWTKQGVLQEANELEDDKTFEYELVGVLVHAGTAEAGHYYSYIKDREALNEKWYEFNDTHVSPFNITNLRNECFGGEYENDEGIMHFGDWDGSKSKNAYLLFYEKTNPDISNLIKSAEKQVPTPIKDLIWNQNINYLKSRLFYDADYFNFIKAFVCLYDFPNQSDVKPIISFSEEQLKEIRWMIDNQDLLSLTKQAQYSDFYGEEMSYQLPEEEIQRNLQNLNQNSLDFWVQTPALQTIKLAITFAHDSFVKTKDLQGFLGWMPILKPLFENYVPACFWFINYVIFRKEMLVELFFEMNFVEAKTAFAKLLIIIFNNVFKREDDYIYDREVIEKLEISSDYYSMIKRTEVKKSCLIRFIDMFCNDLLLECKKNLPKSLDYLQIVKYLCQLSSKIIFYLVNNKILKNFMDIFLSNAPSNSYYSYQPVVIKMNDKITENHLIPLLDIISLIIRGCLTSGIQRLQQFPPTSLSDKTHCPMLDPAIEGIFVDQTNYLSIFFPMQQFSEATSYITKHLAWGDMSNSRFFLSTLRDILTSIQTSWNQVEHIFRVVDGIFKLEDSLQRDRIQYFFEEGKYYNANLTVLEHLYKMKDNERMFAIMGIKCIAEMGSSCQACSIYIRDNTKKFKWMVEYLSSIPQQIVFNPQTPHLPRVITTALNKLREILGLNVFEESLQNKVVNIFDNQSDSEEEEDDKGKNLYLKEIKKIEKKGQSEEEANVQFHAGEEEIENEQEKTEENEKYKKKDEELEEPIDLS